MAGCTKAGRKKKSASNASYIRENRQQVNKDKRKVRVLKVKAKEDKRTMIPHGTARMIRRDNWMFSIGRMWENLDRMSFQKYEGRA
jgi:hypothetical protein